MGTSTEPRTIARRHGAVRYRSAAYWLATGLVAAELGVGGSWDIARLKIVRDVVAGLGYPTYFLVLLGTWKVLGAIALLVPRRALLKEWAYAGAFFTYTGAIVSHLTTGYDLGELVLLAVLAPLTVVSWALRPPSRRTGAASSSAISCSRRWCPDWGESGFPGGSRRATGAPSLRPGGRRFR